MAANIQARLTHQKNRFALIENAVEDAFDIHPSSNTRAFINTSLKVLERNWIKFQAEHDIICQSDLENLEEDSYFRTKNYERC